MATQSFADGQQGRDIRTNMGWLAGSFLLLGALSILLPAAATLAVTLVVAATLLLWGGLGFWMSLSLKDLPEWKFSAGAFGLVAALGLMFLVFPDVGAEIMTLFAVAGFLIEGVFTILFALRLSPHAKSWIWMAVSGFSALALGFIVLVGWPGTANWILGLLIGVNFLTTGAALLALRATIQTAAR